MTASLQSTVGTPTVDCWEHGFDDLVQAGVEFSEDQCRLFRGEDQVVLVAWALPDPTAWCDIQEIPRAKLVSADGSRYTVPVLAETDWDACEELESIYGPIWRRFPSVPLRISIIDPLCTSDRVRLIDSGLTFARMWDILPIDSEYWADVEDCFEDIWLWSDYAAVRDLFWVMNSASMLTDECWLASRYQTDDLSEARHNHIRSDIPPYLWRCMDGEHLFSEMSLRHLNESHMPTGVLNVPVKFNNRSAEAYWTTLAQISQRAREQVLLTAPHWLRDNMRELERQVGRPWD